jgi:serine/threonine-protein kinase HipA
VSYEPARIVEVRAWGRTAGAVTADPATGFYAFEYDRAWISGGRELSPLLMPSSGTVFVFPDLDPITYYRLPAMLADCLPDRFGNALVNAWMVEHGVPVAGITALDRLAYAADRAMGALEFRPPAGAPTEPITAIQLADLVTAARATLSGNLAEAPKDALRELMQVGTSAGGARAKAVVAYNAATGAIRSGQFEAPPGFTQWIIKLDGVGTDPTQDDDPFVAGAGYGRVEYAYSLMARDAGIDKTSCRLLAEGGRAHFMTERFDRDDLGHRVHMQTLCGIAGLDFNMAGAHSYAQYFDVIDSLGLPAAAREQAFRRTVFNIAAANCDDHTKNLAFLLPEDGEWSLAPAYDVTHAHNPSGVWTSGHQMTVNGKRQAIDLGDLRELADRFKVPGAKAVLQDVMLAVDRWADYAGQAEVPEEQVERIAVDLKAARPK